jgi:predicted dehydrogenase
MPHIGYCIYEFVKVRPVHELRKFVQSGDLGKIYCIEAERVNLGLFRSDINVIWDLAPHDISILLYILGKKPEQIRVQAHAHLQPHIHDMAHLHLPTVLARLPSRISIGSSRSGWNAKTLPTRSALAHSPALTLEWGWQWWRC